MKPTASQFLRLLALFCLLSAPSGARAFYDSNLGRWMNRDPIEEVGGLNVFNYIHNNPVNSVDSFGLLNADRYQEIAAILESQLTYGWYPYAYKNNQSGIISINLAINHGIQTADDDFSWLLPTKCNLFGKGRNVYPTRGLLNQRNRFIRIGWGWKGPPATGRDVFRITWGESGGHFNIWPPTLFW